MSKTSKHYLFASVDAPPRVGGVSLLAYELSSELSNLNGAETVFVGPSKTVFPVRTTKFKVYEDFHSDVKRRDGQAGAIEDQRIEDLFCRLVSAYSLNEIILWHPFYYGPGAVTAARHMSVPISVYVHGTELTSQVPSLMEGESDFVPDPLSQELPQRLYRTMSQADRVFVNSSFTGSLVSTLLPEQEVVVTGCGISEDFLQEEWRRTPSVDALSKKVLRERMGLPERTTLVMVGRLVPHKNHLKAIKLVQAMPDTQLVIIGTGPLQASLEEYVDSNDLADRVFFKGGASDADKWNYIRASEAGFLISEYSEQTGGYEGFGIVMLEYAAAGCVPVTNGKFGMQDFAVRYGAGLRCLDDDSKPIKEHAAQLSQALSDPDLLNERLEHARKVIEARYTWKKVAERMQEALG